MMTLPYILLSDELGEGNPFFKCFRRWDRGIGWEVFLAEDAFDRIEGVVCFYLRNRHVLQREIVCDVAKEPAEALVGE